MKKTTLILILLVITNSLLAQTRLTTFDALMSDLKAGKSVSVVINYGECKLFSDGKEEEKSPNAIGGLKLDTYEYFDSSIFHGRIPSFLSSSQTVLINHPEFGFVYNYVKLKIKADNTVEITAKYLKPRKFSSKFKVVMDETFKTKIKDDAGDGAVILYSK